MAHRELVDGWLDRLAGSGLPLPRTEGTRPRSPLTFAAPLPIGMVVEHDLADLVLAARLPAHEVRRCVRETLPEAIELVDLYDVWLGAPALAASVVAADYRATLGEEALALESELRQAAAKLVEARSLPRDRPRAGSTVTYDLRPLLADVSIGPDRPGAASAAGSDARPLAVRMRTRFHPERGAGRPEEVIAALEDIVGRPLETDSIVRERVILAGDS